MYVKVRDKNGNKVYEPQYVPTPRDPEERRSFPLSYWRKSALDRIQLPDGQSVAVDLPLSVIQDRSRPDTFTWRDFEVLKERKPAAAQTLTTDCPECNGKGFIGDEDVSDVELCPLCQGVGKIVTHFGAEIIKFLQWLDNPTHAIDEKGIDRMNKIGALRREAAAKRHEAAQRLGANNLQAQVEVAGRRALTEYQEKMSKEAQRIDAELEAALKALDEKA